MFRRRRPQASSPGIYPHRYHQYPVYLRRRLYWSREIIGRRIGKKSIGFLSEEGPKAEQSKTIGISDRRDIDLLRNSSRRI